MISLDQREILGASDFEGYAKTVVTAGIGDAMGSTVAALVEKPVFPL